MDYNKAIRTKVSYYTESNGNGNSWHNTKNRIKCSAIRQKTHVKDILVKIKETKQLWAGHLTRRTDDRWTKKLTE